MLHLEMVKITDSRQPLPLNSIIVVLKSTFAVEAARMMVTASPALHVKKARLLENPDVVFWPKKGKESVSKRCCPQRR